MELKTTNSSKLQNKVVLNGASQRLGTFAVYITSTVVCIQLIKNYIF